MSLHWRSRSVYVAILLSAGCQLGPLSAAAPDGAESARLPRENVVKAQIIRALDEATELEFISTPLTDVVEVLGSRHQIEIQFDEDALTEAGVGTETPITKTLNGIKLRTALEIMLGELDLTFVVREYMLLITSKTEAGVAVDGPPLRPDPVNDEVIRALGEKTEVQFVDTPLADVMDVLKTRHQIEIQVDRQALAAAGLGTDAAITKTLKGITLRSALELILSDLDLTFVVHEGLVWITSKSEAERLRSIETAPAADNPPAAESPVDVVPAPARPCCGSSGGSKHCRQPRRCRSATRSRRCRR